MFVVDILGNPRRRFNDPDGLSVWPESKSHTQSGSQFDDQILGPIVKKHRKADDLLRI